MNQGVEIFCLAVEFGVHGCPEFGHADRIRIRSHQLVHGGREFRFATRRQHAFLGTPQEIDGLFFLASAEILICEREKFFRGAGPLIRHVLEHAARGVELTGFH